MGISPVNAHLKAMGVPTERQGRGVLSHNLILPMCGIMSHQYNEGAFWDSVPGFFYIAVSLTPIPIAPVARTYKVQGLTSLLYLRTGILQELEAGSLNQLSEA
jgi:hypothetical protein